MEKIIEERFSIKKASNSKFKAKEVLDRIIDCLLWGTVGLCIWKNFVTMKVIRL